MACQNAGHRQNNTLKDVVRWSYDIP